MPMHDNLGDVPRKPSPNTHRCRELGCTKRYARKGDLRRHERESHQESQLKCPVLGCRRAFKRLHRLVEHLTKPCGGSKAGWHPKVAGSTQAEIVIHNYNRRASRGEIVFDISGHRQVHEDDANVGITIDCGGGFKILASNLEYFLHCTCPLEPCLSTHEQERFFLRNKRVMEKCLASHYHHLHGMDSRGAKKLGSEVAATFNDIEEQS